MREATDALRAAGMTNDLVGKTSEGAGSIGE